MRYSDEEKSILPTEYAAEAQEYEDKTADNEPEEKPAGKTYDAEGVAEEDKENEENVNRIKKYLSVNGAKA